QRSQLVVGRLFDRPDLRAPGIVYEHIDPAEAGDGLFDGGGALIGVRDVKRRHVYPFDLREVGELFGASRRRHHAVASAERRLGDAATEAARSSSYQPYTVLVHTTNVGKAVLSGSGPNIESCSPMPRAGLLSRIPTRTLT